MRRKWLIVIFSIIVIAIIAGSSFVTKKEKINLPSSSTIIKEQLKDVETFYYYLDKGSPEIEQKMKKMDLVIIEPIEMKANYIDAAKDNGTLIYGYINAMEGDKWNKKLYRQFNDEDFYRDEQGQRVYFEQWDAYMMDMTSTHYQKILTDEIRKQVVEKELDGVFLDTVGDIDSYMPTKIQQIQREAIKEFMINLKEEFAGISIAQNWGFDTLIDYTAPYVDFIMWEDFSYGKVGQDEWSLEKIDQLKILRQKYDIQIMAIAFSENTRSKKMADNHDFNYMYSKKGSYYNSWED